MPRLSDKGLSLPPSPIRKLVPYAEEAARHGVKVYHLNIGQPDIPTPQVAIDAVKNIHDKIFAYGHSAGLETYRRKLVGYYQSVGIELGYENLLITDGGSEAIFMAMSVCLSEGDEVLIPEPFYANYNGFAVEAGIKVKTIPASIDNDFALPPIEEFDRHITPRTKAILICNPNNPTGYLYSQQELEQLRDIVLKHDLFLICDEVYREFCYDGAKHFSAMNLAGLEQNVIMIDSVSKRYSMWVSGSARWPRGTKRCSMPCSGWDRRAFARLIWPRWLRWPLSIPRKAISRRCTMSIWPVVTVS